MMEYCEAYAKALQLLNVRFLSVGELKKKLMDRGAAEDVIDAVIAALTEERFLDDERLACSVYRYYASKGRYGHLYIANCLRKRQLPVPESVEPMDEYAVAEKLIKQKFPVLDKNYAKAARYLQYRGFSASVIREVLAEY